MKLKNIAIPEEEKKEGTKTYPEKSVRIELFELPTVPGTEILPELKIYGYSKVEDAILAGLVTGDPVLLVGRHGTAKTMLVAALARSLDLKFIAYDASKALFDDVIGYPDPHSLQEGMVKYIPTPLSIWDKEFILIDEISRAMPSMQNKWLEIIRSRTVMGKKIENLRYIFAAMNPPGEYIGAMELDPALLGRFAFIIRVPEIYEMDPHNIQQVINNVSADDAVCLETLHNNNNVKSEKLCRLISDAKNMFNTVNKLYQDLISRYIYNLLNETTKFDYKLDGRRSGMLKRNILAYLSVAVVKYGEKYVKKNLSSLIYHCMENSLPISASETYKESEKMLPLAHLNAISKLDRAFEQNQPTVTVSLHPDYLVDTLILNYDRIDRLKKYDMISKLFSFLDEEQPKAELVAILAVAVRKLLKFLLTKNDVEHDLLTKVVQFYRKITSITSSIRDVELYSIVFYNRGRPVIDRLLLNDKSVDIAYRMIINMPLKNTYSFNYPKDSINYEFFLNVKNTLDVNSKHKKTGGKNKNETKSVISVKRVRK